MRRVDVEQVAIINPFVVQFTFVMIKNVMYYSNRHIHKVEVCGICRGGFCAAQNGPHHRRMDGWPSAAELSDGRRAPGGYYIPSLKQKRSLSSNVHFRVRVLLL